MSDVEPPCAKLLGRLVAGSVSAHGDPFGGASAWIEVIAHGDADTGPGLGFPVGPASAERCVRTRTLRRLG